MEIITKKFDELTVFELYEILRLRSAVFVVEQECIYQDIDGLDSDATHMYIKDENEIVAYLRILKAGIKFKEPAIGRVLSTRRRRGLALKLIKQAISQLNADSIRIEAQVYARSLYEKAGFVQASDEFLEDGIPHIEMLWKRTTPERGAF